jgi:hypothetical protein
MTRRRGRVAEIPITHGDVQGTLPVEVTPEEFAPPVETYGRSLLTAQRDGASSMEVMRCQLSMELGQYATLMLSGTATAVRPSSEQGE